MIGSRLKPYYVRLAQGRQAGRQGALRVSAQKLRNGVESPVRGHTERESKRKAGREGPRQPAPEGKLKTSYAGFSALPDKRAGSFSLNRAVQRMPKWQKASETKA